MTPGPPTQPLVRALKRVLAPVVRLMLAKGMSFPMVSEMLKQVFVEVAERHFRIAGRPQTDSRITLLTGVHRKDVKRLRAVERRGTAQPGARVSLGAQLVASWLGVAGFQDAEGNPLPLPRLASSGGTVSFEALVAHVSKDIRSRAVLDEWLRQGLVHLDEEDRVVLDAQAFVPREGIEDKLYYLGHNLGDHAAAATSNVIGEADPHLERSVHYDGLSEAAVAELAKLAAQQGMKAVVAVNRRAMELEQQDAGTPAPRHRMTFGIYYYRVPVEESPDE